METFLLAGETVAAATRDDLDTVVEVHPQEGLEAERLRLPVDEGDVVDAEGVLERSEPVELLEHGRGVEPRLMMR